MKVFRIAKEHYIRDLSGEGARRYGGRWNRKGTGVLYTAGNRSLAAVEYLVHIPVSLLPADTWIAEIAIPGDAASEEIDVKDLPRGWSMYPAPLILSEIGDDWIGRNGTLVLKVPSAVVEGEWNILINPNHPQFKDVTLSHVKPFLFDERLRK